jgi:hypothetical protein
VQGNSLQGGCGGSDGGGGGGSTFLSFTAGGTVSIGDVLVFNNVGRVIRGSASNPAAYNSHAPYHIVGIAKEAATNGDTISVASQFGTSIAVNFASTVSTGDIGKLAYLTTSAGTCTFTAPTSSAAVIEVGLIYSASGSTTANLLFYPRFTMLIP